MSTEDATERRKREKKSGQFGSFEHGNKPNKDLPVCDALGEYFPVIAEEVVG